MKETMIRKMNAKQQFQMRAETLARKAGLPADWKVVVVGVETLDSNTWGMCHYIGKTIQIRWKRDIWTTGRSTVLHEVAHALCPLCKHNKVWDDKFTALLSDASLQL